MENPSEFQHEVALFWHFRVSQYLPSRSSPGLRPLLAMGLFWHSTEACPAVVLSKAKGLEALVGSFLQFDSSINADGTGVNVDRCGKVSDINGSRIRETEIMRDSIRQPSTERWLPLKAKMESL